ncbi:uridine kinase [Williamsoniiplasma somnilux]|uniref:Uridine kinase n=1 Tax=Williamsoniiplasma somnilux TaxID=215578 RepID=A0A2K8NY20_9MOLU|nr:uridine kinase [Williamsoniiplasma somnilux]ATZ18720.1 uridine kinase [Williamsoniiplasma somnilux]
MREKKIPVYFIIIAGGTASGKTTLAKKIAELAATNKTSVRYWSMDNYYKDFAEMSLEERKKINFDHPNSLDIQLLVEHINKFKNREAIEVPIYDFTIFSRSNKTLILEPADVIILDGILALHIPEIRNHGDLKLFIKTADDIRFIRRLQRDVHERGRTLENVINQYLTTVKPMHDLFVEPSIDVADLIVPYYEGNEVAMDLVATKAKAIIEENN